MRDLKPITRDDTEHGVEYVKLADVREAIQDAKRYLAFFDAGLPVTFMGESYYTKADCDRAIDSYLGGADEQR